MSIPFTANKLIRHRPPFDDTRSATAFNRTPAKTPCPPVVGTGNRYRRLSLCGRRRFFPTENLRPCEKPKNLPRSKDRRTPVGNGKDPLANQEDAVRVVPRCMPGNKSRSPIKIPVVREFFRMGHRNPIKIDPARPGEERRQERVFVEEKDRRILPVLTFACHLTDDRPTAEKS